MAGYAGFIEPRWLEVTRKPVRIPGLHRPLRLLHLSDLHYGFRIPLSLLHDAVTLGLAERPDLICLTGDYVTNHWFDHPLVLSGVFRRLSAAAPAFAVLGNHDVDPLGDILTQSGVRLLENSSAAFESLRMVGLGDLWAGRVDAAAAFAQCPSGVPRILLAHNPETTDHFSTQDCSLMLCGHTHGGQVVLPWFGPVLNGVRRQRFVSGLYRWQGRTVHVTRGVGSLWGVRFNCRPEVSLLELTP